ncbi:MAG TPA: serine/threonine-protein kinase [Bryobacteraceae bacterium]|nr:serine/threonine-protein kinase [Bryobacteraceae bacterium]
MIAPAGRKLGKYEIVRKLGRGGMADVYLAQDGENAQVALKLIEHADDADTRASIEAERRGAALQARLAAVDAHVTRVYDAGDLDGYFFVAMEYIDGQDLAELIKGRPLAVEFAADTAMAVAETLENAHHLQATIDGKDFQGIVHGDIKPKNIRIDSHGEVRVLDFGIAKALSLSRRLTRNEFGSVPYASPERLDTGDVNAQSDLWSLAVTLYEMVTGMQPYKAENTERLERVIRARIAPPPAPDPCPEALRRILVKAMAPDPEMRYATARDFAADLAAFRKGEPVKAAAEDMDATRRTFRPGEPDTEATRRGLRWGAGPNTAPGASTSPVSEETRATARKPAEAAVWPNVASVKKPAGKRTVALARAAAAVVGAVLLYAAWTMASGYRLYGHGQDLERAVETEQLSDLNQIWKQWTELSDGHSSSWLLRGPRNVVKQKFLEAAERVIASYRNDAQPLYEADWRRARLYLSRALEVSPDNTTRGDLRLCDGHLARINGTAHKNPAELDEAVEDFNEAQALLPRSPDPQLGLARVYVYGFKDIDKANAALQQASKYGYKLGMRDQAQLADGYRDRATRLLQDSHNVRGLPQERDMILRAEQDFQSALRLYQNVAPYGNSDDQIKDIEYELDGANFRLAQIADSDSEGAGK